MIPIAVQLGDTPLLIVKWLAVLAGAFAGAFLLSLSARLGVRLVRGKPMPGWGVALTRLGGAGGGGVLVWLLVASMGGFGWGGGGGDGLGGGKGKDKGADKDVKTDDKPPTTDKAPPLKDGDKSQIKDDKPLHVFVLGLKDLKERLKVESPNIDNCYWIQGDPQAQVRDLEGLKKELRSRRGKDPNLKVYMDETPNSPDKDNPHFSKPLERWLRDEKLYTPKP